MFRENWRNPSYFQEAPLEINLFYEFDYLWLRTVNHSFAYIIIITSCIQITVVSNIIVFLLFLLLLDRLSGLVVRVPGYGSRRPEFDFRRYQIF
jgi:hypothetical protein